MNHMTGRDRRLSFEYDRLMACLEGRNDIRLEVEERNAAGLPVKYRVDYKIRSICAVRNPESVLDAGVLNPPVFADEFVMDVVIPEGYPSIDSQPVFRFRTSDGNGQEIPHPWHPNIRWYGLFAGRVCMNMPDTYTDIAWCVLRVAEYLRYELYHAVNEPPYPEDPKVAQWVVRQAEPNMWLDF